MTTQVNHSGMKLGKGEPRLDHRTLRLARYLTAALPAPPDQMDWSHGISSWGMMMNNSVGDCTCAAAGHAIQDWTVNALPTGEVTPSDAAIIAAYSAITGYKPSDQSTDQGANELDVLNYWRQTGVAGRKISGYASVDPQNLEHVKQAIVLFGGAYIGLALPLSAQSQNVWDVVSGVKANWFTRLFGGAKKSDTDPGSWGGHAVWVVAYNSIGPVCVTWGALKQMTWAFWQKYCDESYAVLSPDWLTPGLASPSGIKLADLQADIQTLAA